MTSDKSLFIDMKSYFMNICLANEAFIKASEISEARAKFEEKLMILKNVLYVPELNFNLLVVQTSLITCASTSFVMLSNYSYLVSVNCRA